MVNKLTQSLRMQIRDEFVHGYTNGEGDVFILPLILL